MTLSITVIDNADGGETRLSTEEVHFRTSGAGLSEAPMGLSEHKTCKRYFFVELPTAFCNQRDFAHRNSICVLLSGQLQVGTSDEQIRILNAGDTLALRDTAFEEPSRTITVLSEEPVRALIVQID